MSKAEEDKPVPLYLDELASGRCGLSPGAGSNAAEAASVCLHKNGHDSAVVLPIRGSNRAMVRLAWSVPNTQVQLSHADSQDATKDGAVGVAALCAPLLFGKRIRAQSKKGTGFDYYLGDEASAGEDLFLFQGTTALEISGILCNDDQEVDNRTREKVRQVRKGGTALDARVFVMEFSMPSARTAIP